VADHARRRGPPSGHASTQKGAGALRGVASPGDTAADADPARVLHHRMRLGIVSALAGVEALTFVELRDLLQTTDGNLSVHARKLEEAGLVSCTKSFADRRPRSDYRLTAAGQRTLLRYLAHMEALIAATRSALKR
jgi:DNA-binding HxlR family transcriptional regulator